VRLGLPRVTAASRTTSSTVEDCGHGAQPSTAPADARNTAAALARGAACCVPRNRRGRTPPMGDGREGLVPILVSAPPSASHRNCRSAAPGFSLHTYSFLSVWASHPAYQVQPAYYGAERGVSDSPSASDRQEALRRGSNDSSGCCGLAGSIRTQGGREASDRRCANGSSASLWLGVAPPHLPCWWWRSSPAGARITSAFCGFPFARTQPSIHPAGACRGDRRCAEPPRQGCCSVASSRGHVFLTASHDGVRVRHRSMRWWTGAILARTGPAHRRRECVRASLPLPLPVTARPAPPASSDKRPVEPFAGRASVCPAAGTRERKKGRRSAQRARKERKGKERRGATEKGRRERAAAPGLEERSSPAESAGAAGKKASTRPSSPVCHPSSLCAPPRSISSAEALEQTDFLATHRPRLVLRPVRPVVVAIAAVSTAPQPLSSDWRLDSSTARSASGQPGATPSSCCAPESASEHRRRPQPPAPRRRRALQQRRAPPSNKRWKHLVAAPPRSRALLLR